MSNKRKRRLDCEREPIRKFAFIQISITGGVQGPSNNSPT